jgi:Uma2 family endonuclease
MATAPSPRRTSRPAAEPIPSAGPAETVADLLRRLGSIPARRVRLHPTPGTATERDLIRENESKLRTALYELVDGTLVEKPKGLEESGLAALLIMFLNNFVHPRRLGLVTAPDGPFRIESGSIRLPDVSFFVRANQPGGKSPGGPVAQVAPDLAVEILSKSNTKAEIARKLREYFASGARLAWIVDPRTRTVRVHTSPTESTRLDAETGVLDGGDVLPGFRLALADLFPGPEA